MKIFTFDFYDTYGKEHRFIDVLAHSEDEAETLLRQEKSYYFSYNDWEFLGCVEVTEIDKPKVL